MSEQYCIVLTTTNSETNKTTLIEELLSKSLAACIQTMPIQSHYVWEGDVCCEDEILLIIKTQKACYQQLEQVVVNLHDYDTPQVIQVPIIEGFNPYLTWVKENTRKGI